ncbi:MAG: BTAD domain-containing putative transcriptional regulator [Acidimicrobiia bacterium]
MAGSEMVEEPGRAGGKTPQPSGVVTFLLSDVEGSTQLWQSSAERALAALTRLEQLVAEHADEYSGYLQREQGEGDSAVVAFARATDAVNCVVALQRALAVEPWVEGGRILARMALHTGEVEVVDGSYRGLEVHRCARVRGLAYGGQTLLSERTARLVRASLPTGISLREMGEYPLRGLAEPERVFQLCDPELRVEFPPLRVDASLSKAASAPGSNLQFRVLGPLEVETPDGLLPLGGVNQRVVLAALVLDANRVVSTESLIESVWGSEPPDRAAVTLQGYVANLRKVLEPHRTTGSASKIIVTQKPGYVLRVSPESLDLLGFRRHLDEARAARAAGDLDRAADRFRAALDLWRGPALADLALEPFAAAPVAALEELRLGALEDRIDVDLERGLHGALVAELEVLVDAHPLRERLRAQLMLALYRAGRPAHALRVYEDAQRVLRDELGIEPDEPLRTLEQAILARDQTLDVAPSRPAPAAVVGSDAMPSTPVPVALDEVAAPAFVGRAAELSQLETLLAEMRRGARRMAFVGGEPGIGKTRLLTELAHRASDAGVIVLYGRADDETVVPFQPFVEALRPYAATMSAAALRDSLRSLGSELAILLPELATVVPEWGQSTQLEPEIARYHMFEAVAGFVDAVVCARPVLLLLDDLQWADTATLQLLGRVAQDRERGQLLVVGAYRSTAFDSGEPLAKTLAGLGVDVDLTRFDLHGLDDDEVTAFLRAWTGAEPLPSLGPALRDRTDGNPFFLVETVRHMAEIGEPIGPKTRPSDLSADRGVPATVRGVIARRLADLDERCARTLDAAAIVGRRFDLDLVVELLESSDREVMDSLDEAVAAGFVQEVSDAPGWYRFAHSLARDAIVDGLGATRAIRLHRAAGEAIEARGPDERAARVADLARHFAAAASLGAPEREKAVDYAVRAGDRAMESLAFEEAVEHYAAALEVLSGFSRRDDEVECRILLRQRDAQARAGDDVGAAISLELVTEVASARPAAGGLSFLLDPGAWRPPPWGHGQSVEAESGR